jgi:hypothetical protein
MNIDDAFDAVEVFVEHSHDAARWPTPAARAPAAAGGSPASAAAWGGVIVET